MKRKILTDEKTIMNSLSRLVSVDPMEQMEWIGFDNELIGKFCKLDGYDGYYLVAPAFLVVLTQEGVMNRNKIVEVYKAETVDEVEKIVMVDCYDYTMDSSEIGLEVHVMLYKLDKGYVEIPYRIGRMGSEEIRKCSIEEARDNNFNDIKPKRFSYYDSFAEYCAGDAFFKHLGEEREFDDGLFVELPNVYELDYVYEEEGFDGETYIETEIEETINVDSLILMQCIPHESRRNGKEPLKNASTIIRSKWFSVFCKRTESSTKVKASFC